MTIQHATAAVLAAGLLLGGCSGPSVWEQTYVRDTATVAPLDKTAPVRVRSIPWERMQATLTDMQGMVAASNVHPEDWSAAQKDAAKIKLLQGLQVSVAPERMTILGKSEFRTTETILPDGADRESLENFARKVGATDVVWSNRILGRTEKVIEKPVTSYSTGTFWGRRDRRSRWWDDSYSQSSTTWVPMRVPADDTGFVAFFLRAD